MFSYTEIETKLSQSNWPEDVKKSLLSVCPRLGRWSLSFLNQRLNTLGSEYDAELIGTIISRQPQWYQLILDNKNDQVVQEVNHIIELDSDIADKALLSIILDIRNNKAVAQQLSPDLSNLFDLIEVKYLRFLPYKEVASMLNLRVTSFIKLADILMHIKMYCYYQGLMNSDDAEVLAFRQALENNEQVIGPDSSKVQIWLKDFVENQIGTVDHSAYNVAHYLTNSQLAKKLSAQDKNVISEIIKLYNWLFQPYVSAEEIEHYETQLASKNNLAELTSQPRPQSHPEISKPATLQTTSKKTPVQPQSDNATESELQSQTAKVDAVSQVDYFPHKPITPPAPPTPQHLSDNAVIHDLINKKRKDKIGVVKDPTNIKVEEEQQRIEQDLIQQDKQIQKKLEELKVRNKIK